MVWKARCVKANEGHLHLGCRGINAFQSSMLLGYECVSLHLGMLHCVAVHPAGVTCPAYPSYLADAYLCHDHWLLCSFQMTFVEPMSHTILNGLFRSFMTLICDTRNGLVVDKKPFYLSTDTQKAMDTVIGQMRFPSAYNRPPRLLSEYAIILATPI